MSWINNLFRLPRQRNFWEPEQAPTFKENLQALGNLPRFLKLIWQTSPRLTLANVLLRLLQAGIPVTVLYIGKLIIDEIIRLASLGMEADKEYLWLLVGLEFGLALLTALFSRAISLVDALLGDLFSNETSVRLIAHAARLDLPQFEDARFYDKLERARRQTTGRVVLMSQMLSQLQDLMTILFLGAGLVVFNPWLILLLVLAVLPAFVSETYFNQRSYSLARNWTPERRELDYLRAIGASDQTAKEVKLFGLANFLKQRFARLADQYYRANRRLAIKRAGWGLLFNSLGDVGYYVAYIVIVMQTISGELSIGDLTFLAGSFGRLRGLLRGMLSRFSSIAQSALYLQDLFDFFEMKPQIVSTPHARPFPTELKTGFVFEGVSFKYPKTEHYALREVSFQLHPGEKLALVGENGAGKTTLVKLLARLYDPSEGRILLEGHDLREYELQSLRAAIGVIFQDFVRYHFTAGENIAIGQIDAREDRPQIEQAAHLSLADTVIEKLPDGFEQVLGRRFKKGVELSGGEWQKVALGRAYMREAQLLILDEPTAALDARAEYEVFQRFAELTAGKMAVLISHRFSTVRMADRILVLEKGRMLELGTHEELLERQGLYAELFQLQAQGYQ
ncbi:MAG: ABC transporter ATP-binding protein [Bacteroidetes bacterium]|nr:MAG: ABC transporter ATP-binding protein [Bacteroidota bacterium]